MMENRNKEGNENTSGIRPTADLFTYTETARIHLISNTEASKLDILSTQPISSAELKQPIERTSSGSDNGDGVTDDDKNMKEPTEEDTSSACSESECSGLEDHGYEEHVSRDLGDLPDYHQNLHGPRHSKIIVLRDENDENDDTQDITAALSIKSDRISSRASSNSNRLGDITNRSKRLPNSTTSTNDCINRLKGKVKSRSKSKKTRELESLQIKTNEEFARAWIPPPLPRVSADRAAGTIVNTPPEPTSEAIETHDNIEEMRSLETFDLEASNTTNFDESKLQQRTQYIQEEYRRETQEIRKIGISGLASLNRKDASSLFITNKIKSRTSEIFNQPYHQDHGESTNDHVSRDSKFNNISETQDILPNSEANNQQVNWSNNRTQDILGPNLTLAAQSERTHSLKESQNITKFKRAVVRPGSDSMSKEGRISGELALNKLTMKNSLSPSPSPSPTRRNTFFANKVSRNGISSNDDTNSLSVLPCFNTLGLNRYDAMDFDRNNSPGDMDSPLKHQKSLNGEQRQSWYDKRTSNSTNYCDKTLEPTGIPTNEVSTSSSQIFETNEVHASLSRVQGNYPRMLQSNPMPTLEESPSAIPESPMNHQSQDSFAQASAISDLGSQSKSSTPTRRPRSPNGRKSPEIASLRKRGSGRRHTLGVFGYKGNSQNSPRNQHENPIQLANTSFPVLAPPTQSLFSERRELENDGRELANVRTSQTRSNSSNSSNLKSDSPTKALRHRSFHRLATSPTQHINSSSRHQSIHGLKSFETSAGKMISLPPTEEPHGAPLSPQSPIMDGDMDMYTQTVCISADLIEELENEAKIEIPNPRVLKSSNGHGSSCVDDLQCLESKLSVCSFYETKQQKSTEQDHLADGAGKEIIEKSIRIGNDIDNLEVSMSIVHEGESAETSDHSNITESTQIIRGPCTLESKNPGIFSEDSKVQRKPSCSKKRDIDEFFDHKETQFSQQPSSTDISHVSNSVDSFDGSSLVLPSFKKHKGSQTSISTRQLDDISISRSSTESKLTNEGLMSTAFIDGLWSIPKSGEVSNKISKDLISELIPDSQASFMTNSVDSLEFSRALQQVEPLITVGQLESPLPCAEETYTKAQSSLMEIVSDSVKSFSSLKMPNESSSQGEKRSAECFDASGTYTTSTRKKPLLETQSIETPLSQNFIPRELNGPYPLLNCDDAAPVPELSPIKEQLPGLIHELDQTIQPIQYVNTFDESLQTTQPLASERMFEEPQRQSFLPHSSQKRKASRPRKDSSALNTPKKSPGPFRIDFPSSPPVHSNISQFFSNTSKSFSPPCQSFRSSSLPSPGDRRLHNSKGTYDFKSTSPAAQSVSSFNQLHPLIPASSSPRPSEMCKISHEASTSSRLNTKSLACLVSPSQVNRENVGLSEERIFSGLQAPSGNIFSSSPKECKGKQEPNKLSLKNLLNDTSAIIPLALTSSAKSHKVTKVSYTKLTNHDTKLTSSRLLYRPLNPVRGNKFQTVTNESDTDMQNEGIEDHTEAMTDSDEDKDGETTGPICKETTTTRNAPQNQLKPEQLERIREMQLQHLRNQEKQKSLSVEIKRGPPIRYGLSKLDKVQSLHGYLKKRKEK